MLKRDIWQVPTGMWVLCIVYTLLTIVLRASYVDAEGVRHAATLTEGFNRTSLFFWNGHAPLGLLLLWLIVKPLSFAMPVLEATQLLAAVSMGLTGLVLYRLLRLTGLTTGLCGWLTFLFLTANVALVSATMLGYASFALLLMALWARSAVRFLTLREAEPAVAVRMGVASALLGAINLFALVPALVLGVLAMRRFQAGAYWVALLSLTLLVYLGVYFLVLPAQVQAGGVERAKPSLISWLWTGDGGSRFDPPVLSGAYWLAMGEQVQNSLLALGRPFRVRDVYQYFLGGTFITLLKGAFLALVAVAVLLLIILHTSGERVPVERPVQALQQLSGWSLLAMLAVLILWQGERQAFYLWTGFWAVLALGGWLASYAPEETARLGYALAPLVLVMAIFGLMKMGTLRSPDHDSEYQEVVAAYGGIQQGDIVIAAGRLADLLRCYTAPHAQVIATEYWRDPESELKRLLEQARQQKRRVILWQYALNPDYFRHARARATAAWLQSLQRAQQLWNQAGSTLYRPYSKLVVYPTLIEWSGEAQQLEPPRP